MSIINKDPNTLMVRCECHDHVLEVTSDDLGVGDGVEPDFYFSVWNQSPRPFNFGDRLRLIWRLIRGKNLEGGDVIVNLSDATIISEFLVEKVKQSQIRYEKWKQTHGK